VYAAALQLVNTVLAEESVKASVNALLVASSHKARDLHTTTYNIYMCVYGKKYKLTPHTDANHTYLQTHI
jgi:hypothetical protein